MLAYFISADLPKRLTLDGQPYPFFVCEQNSLRVLL